MSRGLEVEKARREVEGGKARTREGEKANRKNLVKFSYAEVLE